VKAVLSIERKKSVILFNGRKYLQEEQKSRTGRCRGNGATPGADKVESDSARPQGGRD
jgi:hypothetical protein